MISGVPDRADQSVSSPDKWLRRFSKVTCFSTFFLIFAGGMVTSTGSGLAVPDWPLSYGTLFPPMVGGIFYEHGHRMVAAIVGFFTLCLAVWLGIKEKRRWVRRLGIGALSAVVCQGILGGMTVLFLLPAPVSIMHAVLAQTFFILTIIIAYSLSIERRKRELIAVRQHPDFLRITLFFTALVYIQLILGAWMRHTGSGLAIPDFPTMGGYWLPPFDDAMLRHINDWRFDHDLPAVTIPQVLIHFIHRVGALGIAMTVCILNFAGLRHHAQDKMLVRTAVLLNILVIGQLFLGVLTILSQKSPQITSLHVVIGAATLGISVLLFLRAAPLSLEKLRTTVFRRP